MVGTGGLIGRDAEARAVTRLLSDVSRPKALVLEGEPGIGKTTAWLAGVALARERGFRVLAARPGSAETALSYSSLSDLLGEFEPDVWSTLPAPQRHALDRALLRTDPGETSTDPRAVAAALLSVLRQLALDGPLLIAVDDLHWLDTSSTHAVAFALRRLTGRIAVLVSARTDRDSVAATAWLQLPTPDAIERMSLQPLPIGDLHALIAGRIGRDLPRSIVRRIHELSGGNPFYGLELARSVDSTVVDPTSMPASLAEAVHAHISSFDAGVRDALLAVACAAAPTVDLISRAVGDDADTLLAMLKGAETAGIVEISEGHVRFAHPLLARGVYAGAGAAPRRSMHAKLAGLITEPESRARHLALAATSATQQTLDIIDQAAELARKRGAPAAAAELLELALNLGPGGDTVERRVRAAGHHMGAGDSARARNLLNHAIADSDSGALQAHALMTLAVVELFDNSFARGAEILERGLQEVDGQEFLRAPMLATLAFALLNAGRIADAADAVDQAVLVATRSGNPPALLGQILGMRAVVRFLQGEGIDEADLSRALELEDPAIDVPIAFRPSMQNALLLGWSGQLARARTELDSIRRSCQERGAESELVFVSFHACFVAIWMGSLDYAERLAEATVERSELLGGNVSRFIALTIRAAARAHTGHEGDARADLTEALAANARSGFEAMRDWPITVLGFLEVSLGNYDAALTALQPLIARVKAAPQTTEMSNAAFIPDAVEALIATRHLTEAELLIDMLERNGQRLERPWMLAVGRRCRSMHHAARGQTDAALQAADQALVEHDRLAMPFERGRTLLVQAAIHRQSRRESSARRSYGEALAVFEQLGMHLWAARARAEMTGKGNLTTAEKRVARLTASGMTNSEVAAALFVSPKTVEFHLAGIYRKLGIRSRAELGRHVSSGRF